MSKDAAEQKLIEEQLLPYKAYGEEVKYQNWLEMSPSARSNDKKERDKLKKFEKRLLVVAKYRLFVIKKATFGGSRTVHKAIHLYDLVELTATADSSIIELSYNEREKGGPVATTRIKCDNVPTLVSTLRNLVRVMSHGYTDAILKFTGFSADVLPNDQGGDPGVAGGILDIYLAQCSYYRTRPSLEFQRYVQYLVDNNITDLDLSNCPGADPKTDISFDIPTIFESLKFNTYFKAVIVRDVQVKNITDSLGHALRYNSSISRIQIRGTEEDQSLVSFGVGLKANPSNALQVLDLSHNSLSAESVTSLCGAITTLTHALPVLNLSHCGISAKGVNALFLAFEANFGVSLSIQELDLSYNKFDEIATATFGSWLGHIKGAYSLRKLGLANTGVDLVALGSVLRTIINLSKFDFSDNKIEKPEAQAELKTYIECASELKELDLSGCSLAPEFLEELLTQLSKNKNLKELKLNLSDNNFGAKGSLVLARAMADSSYLRALNISLKGKGISEILVSLNTNNTLQELYIGKNLQGTSDMDDLIKVLLEYLTFHPGLNTLDLSNSEAGKSLFPLLQVLGSNNSITSLDISGNQIGDLGASILTDSLATNVALSVLNLDKSGFSLSGWQSLCFALAKNRTLQQLNFSHGELEKSVSSDRKDQLRDLITRITLYLQFNSSQPYPPALPFALPCQEPYDTPIGITPLSQVPAHLRNLPTTVTPQDALSVLNESTSPNFRKSITTSPVNPDYSPTSEYKYVAGRDRSTTTPPRSPISPPPSFAPPPPLSPPPSLSPPPPMPGSSPNGHHQHFPSHPTLSPPPRNNLFAPPPPLEVPSTGRMHSPTAPPAVRSSNGVPPPPPSAPMRSSSNSAPPPPPSPVAPPSPPQLSPILSAPPPPPYASAAGGAPPPPPPPPNKPIAASKDRSAVLSDITKFSKNGLKKTVTNDRSTPKV